VNARIAFISASTVLKDNNVGTRVYKLKLNKKRLFNLYKPILFIIISLILTVVNKKINVFLIKGIFLFDNSFAGHYNLSKLKIIFKFIRRKNSV
jgi:hypothetical protein